MNKNLLTLLSLTFLLTSCAGTTTIIPTAPSDEPTDVPTEVPTEVPSENPSESPTSEPTENPSEGPTVEPTVPPVVEEDPFKDLPPISYVQVFVPSNYKKIYAWIEIDNKTKELLGGWDGTELKPFNNEWKTYDFPGYEKVNVIFIDENGKQTQDLHCTNKGYWWFLNNKLQNFKPGDSTDQGGDTEKPNIPPVIKDSWKDFGLWKDLPEDHWKINNKYNGKRHDFRQESIYFAITTRFYDGDKSNNVDCWDSKNAKDDPAWRGDFKGLIEKMDYIKALGFTSIWITPIVENCSGYDYHGYHAMDFSKVDPRYESNDVDFQKVINEAHKRDMKIILDVVFNHTGNFGEKTLMPMFEKVGDLGSSDCLKMLPNSPLPANYQSLLPGDQYNARIAAMKNTKNDGSDPNNYYHHYGNFSWESFGEQVAQIAGDCVDLNTENPVVAEHLVRCYGEFIKMGVDAFRIDTMKHISRLTFNNYIWPALYEYAHKCGNDDFYMFGEVCTRVREVWNHGIPALSAPFYTWKENKDYPWGDHVTNLDSIEKAYNDNKSVKNERTSKNALLNGINYHTPDYSSSSNVGVIDFPMHWNFQHARDAYRVAVEGDKYYNDSTYNVTYVDSHDYGPDCIEKVRYNQGTDAWAENLSLMFTFRGVPCIFYGSEIEFQKNELIDQGPNLPLAKSGRAYFGDNLEGLLETTDFGVFEASGKIKNTLNSTLSQHIIKLNKIRQSIPALTLGQYSDDNSTGSMSYIRRYKKGNIDSLALITVSEGSTFSSVPNGTYVDVVTGDIKTVTNNKLTTGSLTKGNLRVYVLENESTGKLSKIGGTTTYLK